MSRRLRVGLVVKSPSTGLQYVILKLDEMVTLVSTTVRGHKVHLDRCYVEEFLIKSSIVENLP